MVYVDLGVDYDDVQHEDEYPTVPGGSYPFEIRKVEQTETQNGRPQFTWQLVVERPDDGRQVVITHRTVLPWNNPVTGELDVSGVGMLVAVTKAVGILWQGEGIDTDAYIGAQGVVKLRLKNRRIQGDDGTWRADPDPDAPKVNEVDRFEY